MEEINSNFIVVIAGPTASGKSSLAINLARQTNGELINADSVQFYKGMDIGSAKMLPAELGAVKQHLVDIAEPNCPIDAMHFVNIADKAIKQITSEQKLPIIVGGSNLYLKALLHGLADLPKSDSNLRIELEKLESHELHTKLFELDPQRAQALHPNDKIRLVRAVETLLLKNKAESTSKLYEVHQFKKIRYHTLIICLLPDRDELYARINKRVENMFEEGFYQEVVLLLKKYPPESRPLKSLGYKQLIDYLLESKNKHQTLDVESKAKLIAEISQKTRNYAKQQLTFWRNEPKKRNWQEMGGINLKSQGIEAICELIKDRTQRSSNFVPKIELFFAIKK